jgi:hypothetical protein
VVTPLLAALPAPAFAQVQRDALARVGDLLREPTSFAT